MGDEGTNGGDSNDDPLANNDQKQDTNFPEWSCNKGRLWPATIVDSGETDGQFNGLCNNDKDGSGVVLSQSDTYQIKCWDMDGSSLVTTCRDLEPDKLGTWTIEYDLIWPCGSKKRFTRDIDNGEWIQIEIRPEMTY